METYQPANAQEQMLVHNIASAYLRIQRASRFEAALMNGHIVSVKKKHGKSLDSGPTDDIGCILAMAGQDLEQAFLLLDRYEKRAQSAYYKGIETLRKLQNDRKREPVRQMREEETKQRYLRRTVAPISPMPPTPVASFGKVQSGLPVSPRRAPEAFPLDASAGSVV